MALIQVQLQTSLGNVVIQLDEEKAPKTVENFLQYVDSGFYTNTIFHRVIPGFMVQGGGFDTDFMQKKGQASIENEANNGLKNSRGTIAMARTSDPHSASSQFFINVKNNHFLDFVEPTTNGWGYTVFGQVTEGMDVMDMIVGQKTTTRQGHSDVPVNDVVIEKAERLG